MPSWRLFTGGLLPALSVLAACNVDPPADLLLHLEGRVLLDGRSPLPALPVEIRAWPDLPGEGTDSAALLTEDEGRYRAQLGPFPGGRVDSLRVRVTHADCVAPVDAEQWYRNLDAPGDPVVLPAVTLASRLAQGQLQAGGQVCGAILVTDFPSDYIQVALWIDEISDSARGRWRLVHSISTGDEYGSFSGSLDGSRVRIYLRPTVLSECERIHLDLPVGGSNGSTFGAADFGPEGNCFVPATQIQFYEGAVLTEPFPPGG